MKNDNSKKYIIQIIEERLSSIDPTFIEVEDFSESHRDHNKNNESGHYKITLISSKFAGLSQIEQHRLVYKYIEDLMPSPIHAVILNTKSTM